MGPCYARVQTPLLVLQEASLVPPPVPAHAALRKSTSVQSARPRFCPYANLCRNFELSVTFRNSTEHELESGAFEEATADAEPRYRKVDLERHPAQGGRLVDGYFRDA